MKRLPIAILSTVALAGAAAAADMPRAYQSRTGVDVAPVRRVATVPVVVDELWLRSGCPRNPDCLPPRVMALDFTRYANAVTIETRVDPRFEWKYR